MAGFWQVEVAFSGVGGQGEGIKSEAESTSLKVLPPWMIKQGMNLTKEQRGEVKHEAKMDGSSAAVEISDDKKSAIESDEKKNLQVREMMTYYFLSLVLVRSYNLATIPQQNNNFT